MNDNSCSQKTVPPKSAPYVFELYVSGTTPRSINTIAAVKAVFEQELQGKYVLEIVDIFKNPERAHKTQIMVTPTLIKKAPQPTRTIAGNIAGKERILCGLKLQETNRV